MNVFSEVMDYVINLSGEAKLLSQLLSQPITYHSTPYVPENDYIRNIYYVNEMRGMCSDLSLY